MTLISLGGGRAHVATPVGLGPFTATVTGAIPNDKITYLDGTLDIRNAANELVYSHTPRHRGRGNTTWAAPKRPYKVRSLDRTQRPFNFAASRDWAYMADYNDESYLRTSIAFQIGRLATGRWTPRSRHVRMVWNGEPKGIYRFSETVDVQAGRVDIRAMGSGDTAGNALTGPYFLETSDEFDNSGFRTAGNTPVMFDTPDGTVPAQAAYIEAWTNALETALLGSDESAILALVDIPSWVDWYLLYEITGNTEGRWYKSCKWTKDQDSPNGTGKMILWPPWDFDLSIGINADEITVPRSPTGWLARGVAESPSTPQHPNWIYLIWTKSPTFRAACQARWASTFVPVVTGIGQFIDTTHAEIAPNITEDRALWRSGTATPEMHTPAWLKSWLSARAAWITANL